MTTEPTYPGRRWREFPTGSVAEHARRWLALAPQQREISTPRLAATVQLVRDGADGLDVFMLKRVASMAFAASMLVFPGGRVDPRDADPELAERHWAGPPVADWAARLVRDEATAQQLVVAAVREVFEECGVLLAGRDASTVVGDVTGVDWQEDRRALEAHELSFAELLLRRELVLRSDLLSYRAHWITPEFEPRRYDTVFFAALMPAGQVADDSTSEAASAGWFSPAALLADGEGATVLMPPTQVNLEYLAQATTAADVIAERGEVETVLLEVVDHPDGEPRLRAEIPE